tara:strand:+ start:459 stop:1565 length:1107 start_codon:yes stop_codon:yes gene_type:complete
MVEALAGMILSPVRQLDRLTREKEGDFFEPLWVFVVVVAALHLPALHQASVFFEQRPFWVLQKLLDLVAFQGQSIFLFLAAWVVIFFGASRVLLEKSLPIWRLFNACAYLLIPFAFLLAIGGIFSLAGLDHWALPHRPIHSPVIWVGGELQWFRYAVKSGITFAWPSLVGLGVLWRWKRSMDMPKPVQNMRWGLATWAVVLSMLWVGALAQNLGKIDQFKPVLVGDRFPSLNLPWLKARPSDSNGQLNLGAQEGQILVIDFWASWCGPCMKALPEFEKIAKDYREQGVRVVGVNREPSNLPAAKAVLQSSDPLYTSVVDSGGLAQKVGLQVLPTTYLVGPDGRVRFLHLGSLDADALRNSIDGLLSGQ